MSVAVLVRTASIQGIPGSVLLAKANTLHPFSNLMLLYMDRLGPFFIVVMYLNMTPQVLDNYKRTL